jgi:hypothetical protein
MISVLGVVDIQLRDKFLVFVLQRFDCAESITVPTENIWVPDIALQDTFRTIFDSVKRKYLGS